MTCIDEDSTLNAVAEMLTSGDSERFRSSLETLLNAVMLLERQEHIRVAPFERSADRNGHANGYKDKSFTTRLGELSLKVPQVRGSDEPFYPKSLDKGLRSERALKLALAEMYVQGVSTRKVAKVTGELCGFEVISAQVSRAAAKLDEQLEAWRARPLAETPYLVLDARYEKVRQAGLVRDAAVLVAVGVGTDGKRDILGVSVALSEHETHWRAFLQSLVERGLSGVRQVTSDDHSGLRAARKAVFGSVAWQRCQFHLQQNASAYVPKLEMKPQVAADVRNIFNAPDQQRAEELLKAATARQGMAKTLRRWRSGWSRHCPRG